MVDERHRYLDGHRGGYQGAERRVSNDIGDWREDVSVALATINEQLRRIASDRESEKGTTQRLEQRLETEDRRILQLCSDQHRLLTTEIKDHAKMDAERNEKLGDKVSNIDRRLTLIVGMGTGVQVIIVLAAAALKVFGGTHG